MEYTVGYKFDMKTISLYTYNIVTNAIARKNVLSLSFLLYYELLNIYIYRSLSTKNTYPNALVYIYICIDLPSLEEFDTLLGILTDFLLWNS